MGDKIRYAEVWNERQGKKVIQHHVRYLGCDPDNLPDPSSFDLETIHFGFLAQMILNDTLSADDVYLMLDGMDKPVKRKELKEIVIRYNIAEKKRCSPPYSWGIYFMDWLPYFSVIAITTSLTHDKGCKRKVACLLTTQFKAMTL
jgi:hypothetical protein